MEERNANDAVTLRLIRGLYAQLEATTAQLAAAQARIAELEAAIRPVEP